MVYGGAVSDRAPVPIVTLAPVFTKMLLVVLAVNVLAPPKVVAPLNAIAGPTVALSSVMLKSSV